MSGSLEIEELPATQTGEKRFNYWYPLHSREYHTDCRTHPVNSYSLFYSNDEATLELSLIMLWHNRLSVIKGCRSGKWFNTIYPLIEMTNSDLKWQNTFASQGPKVWSMIGGSSNLRVRTMKASLQKRESSSDRCPTPNPVMMKKSTAR